ncbi:MAG: serine dehydratase [Candidatus Fischerbacteria bacterium RBG_13_37_8]|uniref:Serine dehydratase n=1 Tax=Candidatus Fischerbacteria bacterium RBG_13_37_8 TaxID=1817863 RepID=A0A1F5V8Q3_9BACT|nr:MAG: serine dehydratase [Candidatus Fischerbacteria bacterium RBG_13_37_8]
MKESLPGIHDIAKAHERIKTYINRTPVMTSSTINRIAHAEIFFKCENFQKVGAFKFRGACNAVFMLQENELKNGVTTHSSGNHAAALSLAAKLRGTKAYIVMPETAPEVKKKAVEEYGGEIIFCKPTLEARESMLEVVEKKTNATFIHPYDNYHVISGQGTAAKELLEEVPDLDIVIAPVGGGGLLSGTAIASKNLNRSALVYGAEPKAADDAYRSFKSKILLPSDNPVTIADGLRTSLGSLTFAIIIKNVDDIITVSEKGIIEAMRLIWERMKIIVEPSSAVPLGALLENMNVKGKRIGIILSGGNVELSKLPF